MFVFLRVLGLVTALTCCWQMEGSPPLAYQNTDSSGANANVNNAGRDDHNYNATPTPAATQGRAAGTETISLGDANAQNIALAGATVIDKRQKIYISQKNQKKKKKKKKKENDSANKGSSEERRDSPSKAAGKKDTAPNWGRASYGTMLLLIVSLGILYIGVFIAKPNSVSHSPDRLICENHVNDTFKGGPNYMVSHGGMVATKHTKNTPQGNGKSDIVLVLFFLTFLKFLFRLGCHCVRERLNNSVDDQIYLAFGSFWRCNGRCCT